MKTIKFIVCVIVGMMLMIGVNSCDNKKKNDSSKSSKEKSESVMSDDEDTSSVSESSESTESSEKEKTKESEKLVLIDFYATWCGPCKTMAPIVKQMEEKYGDKLEFRKVDIDKDSEMAEKYRIDAVPTFVILSPTGEEIDRIVGACEADIMDETLWEIINYNTVK